LADQQRVLLSAEPVNADGVVDNELCGDCDLFVSSALSSGGTVLRPTSDDYEFAAQKVILIVELRFVCFSWLLLVSLARRF
jgi:hypothetical protein